MRTKEVRSVLLMVLAFTNMLGMFFVGIDMIHNGDPSNWPFFFGHMLAATIFWMWLIRD